MPTNCITIIVIDTVHSKVFNNVTNLSSINEHCLWLDQELKNDKKKSNLTEIYHFSVLY